MSRSKDTSNQKTVGIQNNPPESFKNDPETNQSHLMDSADSDSSSLNRSLAKVLQLNSLKELSPLQNKERILEGLIELVMDPGVIPEALKGSILLVDCNQNSSSGMIYRLEKLEHRPFSVKTAAELFEALRHTLVDLMIVDEGSLDLLSEEILSFCMNDKHYIPFIVIGSNENSFLIEKAFQIGAIDYLTRPINNALLKVRIESSLQKKAHHNQRQDKLREARLAMESLHTEMGNFEDGFLLINAQGIVINNNAVIFSIYPHLKEKMTTAPNDLRGHTFDELWNYNVQHDFYDREFLEDIAFLENIRTQLQGDSGTWAEKTASGVILIVHFQRTFDQNILITIQTTDSSSLKPHQLAYLAYYDALTRTVNRQFFLHHLDAIVTSDRQTTAFSILLIDLDGFKNINDTYGHAHGDWILKQVSERMKGILRQGDIVSRMGGDEFTILINNSNDPVIIEQISTRLLNAICSPYHRGEVTMEIGASIGIVLYPQDGTTSEGILKRADDAMYSVKQTGKRGYAFANALQKTTA